MTTAEQRQFPARSNRLHTPHPSVRGDATSDVRLLSRVRYQYSTLLVSMRRWEVVRLRPDSSEPTQEVRVARSGVHTFSPAALRRRRELRGFTIGELASLSGVSQASLSNWEAGKVTPTPGNLAAVARALGTEIANLAPVRAALIRMADLRHQAGLSQDEVAATAGVSRATITNVEAGATRPRPATVAALAAAYAITEGDLTAVWERTHEARMARLRAR